MQYWYPLIAYLLGSIPFGLILSNLFGKGNLRESGSKNIGTTNVMRTQGKLLGALTFLLDFGKGAAAVYFLHTDNSLINIAVAVLPVFGHMYPVWLKFHGGKGVATYFGILSILSPITFICTIVLWVSAYLITKVSAVGGITSVLISLPIFYYQESGRYLDFVNLFCALIFLVVVIVFKHKENIRRLINGNELKI
ncbi:MAG: glycerol-3-phosphate 1-O-acyltransferase PlsY [Alphaproteobacteria bacterium]|nr:glycerol-3-phosphate 1-O-acyltransferase PlsY [Alphaproteobacteria bacterium]